MSVYLNCFHKGADELKLIINNCQLDVTGVANSFVDESILTLETIQCWSWERDILLFKDQCLLAREVSRYEKLCEHMYVPRLSAITTSHCRQQLMRQIYAESFISFLDILVRFFTLRTAWTMHNRGIKLLISMVVPHHFGDFLIAEVATALGLKTYFIEEDVYLNSTAGKGFYLRDMESGTYLESGETPDALQFTSKQPDSSDASLNNYSADIRLYIHKARSESIKAILTSLHRTNADAGIRQINHLAMLKRFLNQSRYRGDSLTGYFLVCLHVEPEATLSPLAFMWVSQMEFVAVVAAVLESMGIDIVVREHPAQLTHKWGDFLSNTHLYKNESSCPRSVRTYKELLNLVNMKGFDCNADVMTTLKADDCLGCVSLNGTVLLEALGIGKPVICSNTWIGSACDLALGISREDSIHDVRMALKKIMTSRSRNDNKDMLLNIMRKYRYRCDITELTTMLFSTRLRFLIGR